MSADHTGALRDAAERRLLAFQEYQSSLVAMNAAVREARASGVPAQVIAEVIGTSRQRVYEILREG